ncbi:MAG: sulfite exporter TauE/SafE family protein [Magnetovibrionaceae bacterium]
MDQEAFLIAALAQGLSHCIVTVEAHGTLILSLFVAGLVGSASHCIGMCGPFVLTQTLARLEGVAADRMGEFTRLAGAALVPYHLGRMTTYVVLGALAGAFAGQLIQAAELKWLSAGLLILAALFFLGYGLKRLGLWVGKPTDGEGKFGRMIGRLAKPLFERPLGIRGYGLGIVLGFLPCGLLWGALAAAAASGEALAGAFAMVGFTAGTIPALLGVAIAGHVAGARWRTGFARFAPMLLMLNAVVLSYLAWQMVA